MALSDITQLNNKIAENERKINKIYTEIGERYCDVHSTDAEDIFQQSVSTVLEMKEQNEQWNDQIQMIRGFVRCPGCGKYVAKNAMFCTFCGSRVLPETAVVCPNCGEVFLDTEILFCTNCGTRLPERTASTEKTQESEHIVICKCGNRLSEDDMFCPQCGTPRASLVDSSTE